MEFKGFPKLSRLFRTITITEKIDGTNACVGIYECDGYPSSEPECLAVVDGLEIYAQSRKRLITPDKDNYGFANWVRENAEDLATLGPGYHFGEWWGRGIQRGYDVADKRFWLFNPETDAGIAPVGRVPVLYQGEFSQYAIEEALLNLQEKGSVAAPGYENPEGIVVYHHHGRHSYKITLDAEDKHKWELNS